MTGDTDFSESYFARMAALERQHPWTKAMRSLTLELLGRAAGKCPPRLVLDVGCGTGQFLSDWRDRTPSSIHYGVDLFPSALKHAQRLKRGIWIAASASELPFRPNTFDAIHCADVLQHLSFLEAAKSFDLFAELLRPGGVLALRIRGRRLFRNPPDADYSFAFDEKRLRRELESRGFQVVFVSRTNALPSLYADVRSLFWTPASHDGPVKGIACRPGGDVRSRLLKGYLALESRWLLGTCIPMPAGHTLVCLAQKRQ